MDAVSADRNPRLFAAEQLLRMLPPTQCTVEALRDLVQALRDRHGSVAVQVAVDHIVHRVFPDFVDLSAYDFHEAVPRFGRMVCQQTRGWV